MLEIFFDNQLINPDNYMELKQKGSMFNNSFKLGTTLCREFELQLPKQIFNEKTKDVLIKLNGNDYAHLVIDSFEYKEGGNIPLVNIKLIDKMILFNTNYDASDIVPCTLKDILKDMCKKVGVELGTTDFINSNIPVNFYDNTIQAREYLSFISEVAGGFARIEADGKLYIRNYDNYKDLLVELCEEINLGEKHKIERVVFDNGKNKLIKARASRNLLNDFKYIVKENNNQLKNNVLESDYIEIQPKLAYTISCYYNDKNAIGLNNGFIYANLYDTSKKLISNQFLKTSEINTKITPPNTKYIKVFLGISNCNKGDEFKAQLEKGNIQTEYDEYDTENNNNLETLYINSENVYINNQEELNNIAGKILGFVYYNLSTGNSYILNDSLPGDVLRFNYDNKTYYTINQYEQLNFFGVWSGEYKLKLNSNKQEETQIEGTESKIKSIKIKVNRLDNVITTAVEDINNQKNIVNQELYNKINQNQSLIAQTANNISNQVSNVRGELKGNIDEINKALNNSTEQLNGLIQKNTTLIEQFANSIKSTIKTLGGNNLLRNSVGYSGTDFWQSTGKVTTYQNDNMSLSGSEFILSNNGSLKQEFNVEPNKSYTVSCKIKHKFIGTPNPIKIYIEDGNKQIDLINTSDQYNEWTEFNKNFITNNSNLKIVIISTEDDIFEVTDLIVAIGDVTIWSGYKDEVYGKEHLLDMNGLRLKNIQSGNMSKTTSTNYQLIENEEIVAELSKELVKSDNANFKNTIKIGKLITTNLDENNIVEYIGE